MPTQQPDCPVCMTTRWVCELHPDVPLNRGNECCGQGEMRSCPNCNLELGAPSPFMAGDEQFVVPSKGWVAFVESGEHGPRRYIRSMVPATWTVYHEEAKRFATEAAASMAIPPAHRYSRYEDAARFGTANEEGT